MNRADRRRLQRTARQAFKGRTGQLEHPVPDSITLQGGPMDGWVVKPDAPALRPDWHRGLIEAASAGLYEGEKRPDDRRRWADLSEQEREPYRERTRAKHPPGRYELAAEGKGAIWIAGLTVTEPST